MNRALNLLSRGMLILGALLILGGLAWGIWGRLRTPPPPVITDAGAVVLAVTAPTELPPLPQEPAPTPTPTPAASTALEPTLPTAPEAPTPAFLPEWTITQAMTETSPTFPPVASLPPTPSPPPRKQYSAAPTPASPPTSQPAAEGPPTRIVAPAIKLDATVVPMTWKMVDHNGTMVSEWVVPSKAAGWHNNSALPGHGGNIVISGHHNIEGKVFRYVVDLEPGDEITLYVGDAPYTYTVAEKYILKEAGMPPSVRKKNAQWIMPTADERLTLVTCWPYQWPGNTHRVIVVARPSGRAPRPQPQPSVTNPPL